MAGVNSFRLAWIASFAVIVCFTSLAKPDEAALLKGKAIFEKQCSECHGDRGQGVKGEYDKPLVGDWPLEKLTRVVDKTMPELEPELCRGENARLVAGYVFFFAATQVMFEIRADEAAASSSVAVKSKTF